MSLWHDIGFSLRSLRRQPGLVLTSLTILTLGIGVNATIFTAVKTILLDPLPYHDPSRLMMLYEAGVVHNSAGPVSPPDFYDWQRQSKSFTSIAAVSDTGGILSGGRARLPENIHGVLCTWSLFQTLGVRPALGRRFARSDDTPKAARTIVLSNSLWRRRFDADPQVLGKTLRLDSALYTTIIGVMPPHFDFWDRTSQYWIPLQIGLSPTELTARGDHRLWVVGRLKYDVPMRQANAELSAIQARYKHEHPDAFVGSRAQLYTLWSEVVDKSVQKSLYILWAAVGCVLLIACVNIANLLLTRSTGRRREMAIRTALGATRRRIVWLFLLESLVLSCSGGLAGILLASWLTALLVKIGTVLPRASEIQMDWTTVAFAVALSALSGLAAGLLPAFTASRIDLNQGMHESGRSSPGSARQKYRNTLIVAEIALSFLLLAGAGLLMKSFVLLRTVDAGFKPGHLLTMGIDLTPKYSSKAKIAQFYEDLLQRVDALPGVRSAGLVSVLPIVGHVMDTGFSIAGRPPLPPGQSNDALVRVADPHYFRTMGIPLLKGRFFLPSDRLAEANKAIISESFARRYFPNENPIGRHMTFFEDTPKQIVGVVGDVRKDIAEAPEPIMYGPAFSGDLIRLALVVRAKGDPLALALPIQKQIAKLDPDLAVSDVLTMDELISKHTASQQLNLMLLSCFAGLAVLLAAIGLYAVLSYSATQRMSEFGIRLALGATPGDLVRSVLKQGLVPAIAGLAVGFTGAYFLAGLMKSMLFEVQPFDPVVFLAVALGLLFISMLACLVPALRTTRIDPAQALRTE